MLRNVAQCAQGSPRDGATLCLPSHARVALIGATLEIKCCWKECGGGGRAPRGTR